MSTVFCCLQINTPNKIFALKQNKYCAIWHVIKFLPCNLHMKIFVYLSAVWRTTVTVSALNVVWSAAMSPDCWQFWLRIVQFTFPLLLKLNFTLLCRDWVLQTCLERDNWVTTSSVPSVSQYYGQLFTADLGPVSAPSPSAASRLPPPTPISQLSKHWSGFVVTWKKFF